ncbi:DUF6774 domain-containing protein [Porcipelethomonas sp.]|uniref:DUF6774 domain-containing protein n=1 Tax=Porcipelethomonas sp. TaxID=2981675 RepID=UPI003EF5E5B6
MLTPCELTASVTAFANMFASKLCDDELALWGAVFTQLGDTLETIAVQRDILKKSCKSIEKCEQ